MVLLLTPLNSPVAFRALREYFHVLVLHFPWDVMVTWILSLTLKSLALVFNEMWLSPWVGILRRQLSHASLMNDPLSVTSPRGLESPRAHFTTWADENLHPHLLVSGNARVWAQMTILCFRSASESQSYIYLIFNILWLIIFSYYIYWVED